MYSIHSVSINTETIESIQGAKLSLEINTMTCEKLEFC